MKKDVTAIAKAVPRAAPATSIPAPYIVKEIPKTVTSLVGKMNTVLNITSRIHIRTLSILGTLMFPLLWSMLPDRRLSCINGSEKANIMKYSEAIPEMDSSPPSQPGRNGHIAQAIHIAAKPNTDVAARACLSTSLAIRNSPAPTRCATCTLNPTDAAERIPPKSHVLVDIRPIAADASAPRLPTIEASIYTITM